MTSNTKTPTTLTEALTTYDAEFSFDETAQTWCLFGTTKDGLGWETDDYPAETRDEAEGDALNYLIVYNS